jgi:hypothetical protein
MQQKNYKSKHIKSKKMNELKENENSQIDTRRMESFKYADMLEKSASAMFNSELGLIERGCHEQVNEDIDSSFLWTYLQSPAMSPELCGLQIEHPLSESYNQLAGALALLLKKQFPKELQMQGLSIRTEGNTFQFCISGSISEDNLQKFLELHKKSAHSQQ